MCIFLKLPRLPFKSTILVFKIAFPMVWHEVLTEIAKLARSKAFCNALINAADASEVVDLLQGE